MLASEKQTINVVKDVSPAVVSIVVSKLMPKVKKMSDGVPFGPFGFFGASPEEDQGKFDGLAEGNPSTGSGQTEKVKVGGGSGFIVDSGGLILTNKHVVFDADAEYTVVTNDDKEYPAKVISRDPINDVALLKIQASHLPTVKLGNSNRIELGQTVVAIGNALGQFSNTVSKGIISGLGRKISAVLGTEGEVENLRNVIQTDVAINQGNSGGPLINMNGEVIGINTAIIYGAQNIGFALPINWAKADLEQTQKAGRIIRPYIGLRYVVLNPILKEHYSLPVDYGALVIKDHIPGSQAVVANSPAAKAGLKENDIVLEVNGTKITEKKEIADIIQEMKVGDELELTVMRPDRAGNNETMKVKTTLEERK